MGRAGVGSCIAVLPSFGGGRGHCGEPPTLFLMRLACPECTTRSQSHTTSDRPRTLDLQSSLSGGSQGGGRVEEETLLSLKTRRGRRRKRLPQRIRPPPCRGREGGRQGEGRHPIGVIGAS
eukprot:632302-Hanusia_phi.AAC.1